MAGRFSIEAIIKATDRLTAPVRRMQKSLDSFSKSASDRISKLNKTAEGLMGGLTKVATVGVVAGGALSVALYSAAGAGMDFQQGMANVGVAAGATAEEFAALRARALELGSSTKFSGTQVTEAMESMAKQGFTTSQILQGVPGLLAAAAADGGDLASISSGIMSSLKSMGLGPEKMQEFADAAAKAGDLTAASIGSITDSFSIVGPVARQLNIPFKSVIGQLAILQDAGLDASSSATALAATYSKLAAPMGKTEKEMKALGLSVKDSAQNFKKPDQLFAEILSKTGKLTGNVDKMGAMTRLVGLESQKALLNMAAAAGDGRLAKMNEDLSNTAGYSEKIAKLRLDTLTGDVTKLGSAFDAVKITLFDVAQGGLRSVVQQTREWLNDNKAFAKSEFLSFLETAKPLVGLFADGVRSAVREVSVFAGPLKKAGRWLNSLFGGGAPGVQAFELGKNLTRAAFAIFAFTVFTKAATAATFAFGVISTGTRIAVGLFTFFLKAARTALIWYEIASKAGAAGALALALGSTAATLDTIWNTAVTWARTVAQWASNAATAAGTALTAFFITALYGQATAGTVAAGGMGAAAIAVAAFALAAGAALAAVMILLDALKELREATAGLGITGIAKGVMNGKGVFESVDDEYNRQARERAKLEEQGIAIPEKKKPEQSSIDMMQKMVSGDMQFGMDPTSSDLMSQMQGGDMQFGMDPQMQDMMDQMQTGGFPGMDGMMNGGMDPAVMAQLANSTQMLAEAQAQGPMLQTPDEREAVQDTMTITINDGSSGGAEVTDKPKDKNTKVAVKRTGEF